MIIRSATPADIAAITAIYAHHVLTGTGTFEEAPPDDTAMAARMGEVQDRGMPWLVADDGAGSVAGYAYAGPFRTRTAYRFTLEDSVYVSPRAQGRGVGRGLLTAVVEACTAAGYRQMLALIGDADNTASVALHRSLGFIPVGVFRDVGFKADRWLDVVMMQRALGENQR